MVYTMSALEELSNFAISDSDESDSEAECTAEPILTMDELRQMLQLEKQTNLKSHAIIVALFAIFITFVISSVLGQPTPCQAV